MKYITADRRMQLELINVCEINQRNGYTFTKDRRVMTRGNRNLPVKLIPPLLTNKLS